MKTGSTDCIDRKQLDQPCFQHDMAYGKSEDLAGRIESDKALRGEAFKIASNPKYDRYQGGLASVVYKFFDKKIYSGSGIATESNYQLADELHRQIIRNFQKRKLYSLFRDNIWGNDLVDSQSLSKYNKGI